MGTMAMGHSTGGGKGALSQHIVCPLVANGNGAHIFTLAADLPACMRYLFEDKGFRGALESAAQAF